MKIWYIGQFNKTYSSERYISHALREHGVVVYADKRDDPTPIGMKLKQLEKFAPDCVLTTGNPLKHPTEILKFCNDFGAVSVCWLWDIYGGRRFKIPQHFKSDILFSTDGGNDEFYSEIGANHKLLRQGIHCPEAQKYPTSFSYDVGFVGSKFIHDGRIRLVEWLEKTYRGRFIHVNNCRHLKLNEQLAKIRIVVGDSYPGDHYWSNRIYEMLGRGAFFLHPYTVGLDSEFTEGVHYVGYERDNWKDLSRKIQYFLDHESERETIRNSGHSHTVENYTYGHRVTELLGHIQTALKQRQGVEV